MEEQENSSKFCYICGDNATCKSERGFLCDKDSCHKKDKKKAKAKFVNDPGILPFLMWP